ncbi:hypothetical protein L2719_19970 [Shewanella schlegeliana]|uniref:DUF2946 domain-containing protein n=1 Tax=Shewanella schlegeliana TaxID=190308 RepID=A0ABS1T4G6_9GAMM|nr:MULTISPECIES: hypothetical protein [Shewanella]MBL4915490.1 hypothetical protein [Shewanella schlegeliana]MCG9731665.1 hypothetical protein [Shewanella sp. Isolate13]MCL1111803.1 hypothetical protein [Shewanella schlegeliana]GIU36589.1 hypothetical protein TUM4433_35590 [Shewanella schlegeliana]
MSSLGRFIRAVITSPAVLGRVLLIVILTMQSMVAMADDCTLSHDDCGSELSYFVEHEAESANGASQCDETTMASHVEDDCTECSNNCCSCCLTLMHPIAEVQAALPHPDSFVFSFNSTSVETPYYAFLRPPKAEIV